MAGSSSLPEVHGAATSVTSKSSDGFSLCCWLVLHCFPGVSDTMQICLFYSLIDAGTCSSSDGESLRLTGSTWTIYLSAIKFLVEVFCTALPGFKVPSFRGELRTVMDVFDEVDPFLRRSQVHTFRVCLERVVGSVRSYDV